MADYKFQKLTPTSEVKLNAYEEALDFVFANADVKNVAISGAYSAGKSSVIESYKKLHPSKRYIHISLACFKPVDFDQETAKPDGAQTASLINENVLEGKILNQLVHQINTNKIPQTNFRVKRHVSKLLTTIVALCLFLFGGSLFYIINFDNWLKYVNDLKLVWLKNALSWTTNSALILLLTIVMVALGVLFVYNIIQLQKNKNLLKKVSVQGNGIEIFEHCDDSYFDKYLNEVIYLFENSGADVIVFEDMDRYEVNQIFQRLRDINTIVNNRRQMNQLRFFRIRKLFKIKNKPPLRFFYLLRDDIFVSKDRTKFFDFLIPIVPILDGSNSYDQFIAHFKDGEILGLFDSNFLQGISLYVDDMRILKNIYNEFRIYYKRIGITEQNPNKLLALIVYKNIFPRDFGDLQLNRGFVFTLFDNKHTFISNEKNALREQISLLNSKISASNSEVFKSENELNEYYRPKINNAYGANQQKLTQEKDDRIEAVRNRENGNTEKFKIEIDSLQGAIKELDAKKLYEIINRDNISAIFQSQSTNEIGHINQFNEIKSSEYFPLLKYLLRNGFIDETYPDYMTYFYENSLSRTDKVFLRSVTDKIAKEFTYELKDPELVMQRLAITDSDNIETLNFDLLAFLLKNKTKYPEHLRHIMIQLKKSVKLAFIEQFFESGKETELFIGYINNCWPQLFDEIRTQNHFSDSLKKQFALATVYYTSNDDLLLVDTNGVLSDFISNSADFLKIDAPKVERITEVFRLINVRFTAIDVDVSNSELWNAIYSNNMYEINNKMLETILEMQYGIAKTEDFKHKNYTLVLSKPKEPLKTYVQENIEPYVKVMLSNCGKSILDSEETIACFLNDESISDETKSTYIEYLQSDISALSEIDDSQWWPVLINKRRLTYSDANVLCYFFGLESKLDDVLIGFINHCGNEFAFDYNAIDKEYGENCGSVFWNAILQGNSLDNNKYKLVVKSLHRVYNSFSTAGISKDKIDILIDIKVIRMSSASLEFIRANYPDNTIRFIKTNIDTYTSIIDASNFSLTEMLEVLHLDVADKYKIKLLAFTSDPISIANQKYSAAVESHILENNFDMKDLKFIVQSYHDLSESSKATAQALATSNVSVIISNKYALSWSLLFSLISRSSIDITDRSKLFSQTLNSLDEAKCKSCLEKIGQHDFLSLFDGKRPKFEKNELNESILKSFKEKRWITKFEEETSTSYRAYGRKRH